MADVFLSNSLTRKKEKFAPPNSPEVGLYTCGMTVYDYAHIGHGRKYVMDDILRRVLTLNGYKVKHVQNVTDVGHLASDADEGEDKLEKGAKKTGKTVWEVAEFFTNDFYTSMDKLNILRPNIICKATDNIKEQIELVEKLIKKGHAYDTPEAVYFDVLSFPEYGKLFGQDLSQKMVAAREEVKTGEYKKNPADFALWFKRVGRFKDHTMHWNSPWGDGFPGWHIECSAMSIKFLGEQFDIHTGGIDHLPIHHPNEIAQSEGATGKSPFVKYWIHYNHLMVNGRKMSKSLGNYYTINDVVEKGFDPLSLRYLYLTAHYADPLNFTWDSLSAAQSALGSLKEYALSLKGQDTRTLLSEEKNEKLEEYQERFVSFLNDDLATPKAIAIVWEVLKSNIPSTDKYDFLIFADEVVGLGLSQLSSKVIPEDVQELANERDLLRKEGKFEEADKVRQSIEKKGFTVLDSKDSTIIK